MKTQAVYYDPSTERSLERVQVEGIDLTLTREQEHVLRRMLELMRSPEFREKIIPMYISAETGAGKTELGLSAAVVVLKAISAHLRKVHAVYLSPTRQLASQVEARFLERFGHLAITHLPGLKMRSVSGKDADKRERVRQIFDVFLNQDRALLATNPQFLASLATKHMQHYGLPSRSGYFQFAASLALANLFIIDEPHFYTGKSLVRLLTLLLAILRYKSVHGHQPTILLFISATMQVPEIDDLLSYLHTLSGLNDAPLVANVEVPLDRRWLDLTQGERGEKWSLLGQCTMPELETLVRDTVNAASQFTVVYWDNIPGLLKLQEALTRDSIPVAVLHAQMPKSLQREILEQRIAAGRVRAALVTSIAEIGIEFERYGVPGVDRMVSINAQSVAKTIQRWGRLARRKNSSGIFAAVDLPSVRTSVTGLLENGTEQFILGQRDYPSLLHAASTHRSGFFTAYRSPKADLAFAHSVITAIDGTTRSVPAIYLGSSFEVAGPDGEESLSLPLVRLSAGAMQIESQFFLEFRRSAEGFHYALQPGRLRSAPEPLLTWSLHWEDRIGSLPSLKLPEWCRHLGAKRAILGNATMRVAMPVLDWVANFHSPVIGIAFPRGCIETGRAFPLSATYLALSDAFEPATQDLDIVAIPEDDEVMVYVYERTALSSNAAGPVGAIEFAWHQVLGGSNEPT